jgi:deoxyribose-phosphate aldolase
MTSGEVARLIDHTLLRPDATGRQIEALCREAIAFGFVNVCINPTWVADAARLLDGSGVGVCAVVAFPLGATTAAAKECETRGALADGAVEIDVVINIGALKSGDRETVRRELEVVIASCRESHARSKVIIEAALLTDEEKAAACMLAQIAGADFVKTSTGFGPGGATAADVRLMRRVVGPAMGIKAAGGIRDRVAIEVMVAAGATRIGTSAGAEIMRAALIASADQRPIS